MNLIQRLREAVFPPARKRLDAASELALALAGYRGGSHAYLTVVGAPIMALRNSAVYSCVKLLAETISTLSWRLVDAKTKAEITNHPIAALLKNPNPEQTGVEFLEMYLVNYLIWGNAYAEKVIRRGQVSELWPFAAARTVAARKNGARIYEYVPQDGKPQTILGDYVVHLRMLGCDDITGTAPIWAAEKAICLALTQEEMLVQNYADGVRPDYVIHLPPEKALERLANIDVDSLKADKVSLQAQIENSRTRRGLYVPFGYEVTPYSANYQQSQMQESRDFQVLEIARIWRVPPTKLGVMSKATTGQTESERIDFYEGSIRPLLVKLERRFESDLLTDADRQRFQIRFNVRSLLRADTQAQTEQYARLWGIGVYTANEIRAYEDLPPLEDPRADVPNWPANATTDQVGGMDQPTNPAVNPAIPPAAPRSTRVLPMEDRRQRSLAKRQVAARVVQPLMAAAVLKILRKEQSTMMEAARKLLEAGDRNKLRILLRQLYGDNGEMRIFILNALQESVSTLFAEVRDAVQLELDTNFTQDDLDEIRQQYLDIWARDYSESSMFQMEALLDQNPDNTSALEAIDQRFKEWTDTRAAKESLQESRKGKNVFTRALYKLAGVGLMRWVVNSPCDLCAPYTGLTFSTISGSVPNPPIHRGCECDIESA